MRAKEQIRESGYALVALVATVTVMLIMMAGAMPTWKYLMQNEREEELLFRGGQIADGIRRYQAKNGNALPTTFEVLVKGKFLRKSAVKDPMMKDGEWRLVRQGEPLPGTPVGVPGVRGASPSPSASPTPAASRTGGGLGGPLGGTAVGAMAGVASRSTDKSLRLFNGREHYNEWVFLAGQPRPWAFIQGRARLVGLPQQPGVPGAQPGTRPPAGPLTRP